MNIKVIANCFPSILSLFGIFIILNPNDGFWMNFFGVFLVVLGALFQFLWLVSRR